MSDTEEHAIALGEPGYPEALRRIDDPPAILYARGRLARSLAHGAALGPAVAIVGARDATAYGLAVARDLAREVARRGFVVVSGLALGVDGAAHRGALDAGGVTVAVVGAGTDVVYPRSHGRLRADILASGTVIGELAAGVPPLQHHFPARNRIISGLALGVVVVEATLRSGSLGTARHALEQGREVFAVPGLVTSLRSRGPHALLKAGARLVESVDDVLSELPPAEIALAAPRRVVEIVTPRCVAVLERIAKGAGGADEIAALEGRQVGEILEDLLELELSGRIVRGPGGRFAVTPAGAERPSSGSGASVD